VKSQAQESSPKRPRLIAIAGSQPAEFPLDYDEILIGSGPGNDLVLQDATVSRHHARLVRDDNGCRLTDFETVNGTFVNGKRITGTVVIAFGDKLGFGSIQYELGDTPGQLLPNDGAGEANGAGVQTHLVADEATIPPIVPEEEPVPPLIPPILTEPVAASPPESAPRSEWHPDTPEPMQSRRMAPLLIGGIVAALFAAAFVLTKYALRYGPPPEPEESPILAASTTATLAAASPIASPAASIALASPKAASVSPSPHPSPHPRHAAPAIGPIPAEPAELTATWLLPLNRYRGVAHLLFVNADPAMTAGAQAHARYLVKNYRKELRQGVNLGALTHREDAANPWYTSAGSAASALSDTHFAVGTDSFRPASRSWAFDSWMTVPFHRLWILNPALRRVGYGEFCERGVCGAVLEVRSPDGFAQAAPALPYPVEFPPNGSIVRMTSAQGEWPNPLAPCPGYSVPSGLPLTLQLGQIAQTQFSGYTLTLNGTVPAGIEACGFNNSIYHNPDPVAEKQAQATLRDVGAIVLIPRSPLAPGNYTASINAAGQQYTWSFTVSP